MLLEEAEKSKGKTERKNLFPRPIKFNSLNRLVFSYQNVKMSKYDF